MYVRVFNFEDNSLSTTQPTAPIVVSGFIGVMPVYPPLAEFESHHAGFFACDLTHPIARFVIGVLMPIYPG